MKIKTIGILGGMGPNASAVFYQQLINHCQNNYLAIQDNEFPPIIIQSLTLDGFDESGIVDFDLVKNQLICGVKKLEKSGADLIVMACNSVHYFYSDLQKSVNVPIINLIEIMTQKVESLEIEKVGILSSESTAKLKMFEKEFAKKKIKTIGVGPEDQIKLNHIIEAVMAGQHGLKEKRILKSIITKQKKLGAQAIILGCTELPLVVNDDDIKIKVLSSLSVLTEFAVDAAYNYEQIFINDEKLSKVLTQDNSEEMVNIKDYLPKIIFKPTSYLKKSGFVGQSLFIRKNVATKLAQAQKLLPNGYKLVLMCGFRPLSLQKKHFQETFTKISKEHPNWTKKEVMVVASKNVAPLGLIIPPHSTGGAIDVTLADKNGHILDMGTNYIDLSVKTYTNYAGIPDVALKNRKLLVAIMDKVGMINYPTEWWHWSYGDQYWVAKTGNKKAIYGSVKLNMKEQNE